MKQKIWEPYTYQHRIQKKNNFRCLKAKRSMRKFTCKNADHKWPHFLYLMVRYRACDYMMSYDRTPTFIFYLVDILSEQFANWTVCRCLCRIAVSRKGVGFIVCPVCWPASCPCENFCFFMLWFDFIHRGLFILPYSIHNLAHQVACFQNTLGSSHISIW